MTIAVYMGCKATKQTNKQTKGHTVFEKKSMHALCAHGGLFACCTNL